MGIIELRAFVWIILGWRFAGILLARILLTRLFPRLRVTGLRVFARLWIVTTGLWTKLRAKLWPELWTGSRLWIFSGLRFVARLWSLARLRSNLWPRNHHWL